MSYYIDLEQNGVITEEELSEILPIYSACNSPTTSFNTCSHEEMATNYVDLMAQTIQNYNPNLTEYEALGIAWVGLDGTDYWNNNVPGELKSQIAIAQFNMQLYPETTNVTPCE